MRLIDADALRARYQLCVDALPDAAKKAKSQLAYCIDMLNAAPTVSCDECVYGEHRYTLNRCDACHCGDNFERRTPWPT